MELSEWGVTDRAPRFPQLRDVSCYAVLCHSKMPPKYLEVGVGLRNKPVNCQYPQELFPLPRGTGPSSGLPDTCAASYLPVANCPTLSSFSLTGDQKRPFWSMHQNLFLTRALDFSRPLAYPKCFPLLVSASLL